MRSAGIKRGVLGSLEAMPNRLAEETSPYLLQHKDNPVDWRPWGPAALSEAAEGDKPILLSIGYSACHWCHVMERESFEDAETAAYMNEHFVPIKVDREERPDVDDIYMEAVQGMTGQGGWPLTVFLDSDGIPFYGGTYFPPEPRQGMPSFRQVLEATAGAYRTQREELREASARIRESLTAVGRVEQSEEPLDRSVLDRAVSGLESRFDSANGGFGGWAGRRAASTPRSTPTPRVRRGSSTSGRRTRCARRSPRRAWAPTRPSGCSATGA